MQTTRLIVIFGLLVVGGLAVSVIENQVTLEGISQGNGRVSLTETLSITADLDREETSVGVFAVQVMEFSQDAVSVRVFDPLDAEIIQQRVDADTLEGEFDVYESGTFKMVIESTDEIYVAGAIGPRPDADTKLILVSVSLGILITGMIGLAITAIYGIKNRKSV